MKNHFPFRSFLGKSIFAAIFLLISLQANAQLSEEDFESGIPSTWSLFGNTQAVSSWEAVNNEGYQGSNAVTVDPSQDNIGDQNTAEYYLVTPQITVPENGLIRFYTKKGTGTDNSTEYQLKLSTANQPDINGFSVTLQTYTTADLNTSYAQKTIQIPSGISAGIDVYIAFVAVNTQNGSSPTGTPWFLDNVEVLQGCSPVVADDVNIDNITTDGASITWSHPTATDFEVAAVPAGDPAPTSGTAVTGTSYSFTGLDADTDYEAYIKTDCANDTGSEFAGPFPFTTNILGTSCSSPIDIPDVFINGEYDLQDNLANYANPDITYSTQGSGCLDQSTNYLNGDKAFFTYTASADGLITLSQSVAGYDPSNPLGNCYNSNTSILIYGSCADVGTTCLAATTTNSDNHEAQIQNFVVSAGETYIIVMSSDLSPGAGICFDFSVQGSTCASPSGFSYDDLSQNSVKISWENPGGFADSWEYVALPEGTGPPTGAGTSTGTNTDNDITGLNAGTAYDFYVRSVCGGTPGNWGDPFTFTTQCSVFSTPYEENFEGTSNNELPDCWYAIDNNNDGITWSTLQNSATLAFFDNPVNDDYLVSPAIDMSGGQKRLRFKYGGLSGDVHFEIAASTQGVGADNFTTVIEADATYEQTGYGEFNEVIIPLDASLSGTLNFTIHVTPDNTETATRININDFVVEEMPACPNPLEPQVDGVSQNTATLSWSQGYQETQWEVYVQPQGDDAPTASDSGTLTSDNPYTDTGLDPATHYEYYVRAHCSDSEQSEWVGPVEFFTDCTSYDTPFFESFNDDDPDTQKDCWEIIDNNNDNFTFSINTNLALIQGGFFGSPPSDDYLVSPAINLDGTNKLLRFKYRAIYNILAGTANSSLSVLISTTDTDPSSFTEIEPTFSFENPEFMEKEIYVNETGPVYFAFYIADVGTGVDIDDVEVVDAPSCPNPTGLTLDNVTQTTAEVSWQPGFQESNWDVAVVPTGSGVPTSADDATTNPSYNATELSPNTTYDFYMRASCGANDKSEWVGPLTFTTLCDAYDTPFTETFNTDSQSEECWQVVNANDDEHTWDLDSQIYPYEGDQSAGMFTGTNGMNNDWMITPALNITANQRLRYYYKVNDSFFTEDLEILLSTTGSQLDDFTTVLYDSSQDPDPINNEAYLEKIINLPSGVTGQVYIAFHVPHYNSTGTYRGQSLFIDNVNVEDIPDCPNPSNLMASNITDTEVQLNWDANGSESTWEIAALPAGSDAPNGDVDPQYSYDATSNPFTITGLDPSTQYDFYIRANCGPDSQSEWVGPTEVTTQCDLDNLCEYKIILYSDSDISAELQVSQNNQNVQSLPFDGDDTGEEFTVFLCTGIQYSLYFETVGSAADQYANYSFEIQDASGNTVYTSPTGLTPHTTVYTGTSNCGTVSCPQPTDLSVNAQSVLSWTPGGSEAQWEVAVQPVNNGTIPQSGTVVNQASYTPVASDFVNPNAATYEYFVRAICGDNDKSYWSGPYEFVRNDDSSNAIELPVNSTEDCATAETDISFIHASVSSEASTCVGTNQADVWFSFEATSKVHIIEANGFTGNFYTSSGEQPYPDMTMSLYHVEGDGSLTQLQCSNNNVIVASYSTELTVGDTYQVRLTLNDPTENTRLFHVCVTTPNDLCGFNAVNYGFERPPLHTFSGVSTIGTQFVVPGWRKNMETDAGNAIFIWESLNAPGFNAYDGSQCIQLISDDASLYDESDPDIHGIYKDFDSSEITDFDYSFATQGRSSGKTIQLFAGPPEGPFTLVTENEATVGTWTLIDGTYDVPQGQDETRFIFRAKNYAIGILLDNANFKANTDILTEPQSIACDENSIDVEANGSGTWMAADDNPSETEIADADSNATTISGFLEPGTYTYTWQTRYCEHEISFDYNGVGDMPMVDSPVEYCLGEMADPLTAPDNPDYTLMWFTGPTGGTGSTTAPTPDTTTPGTTTYYVAYVNDDGCEGPRAMIDVIINNLTDPVLDFTYDETCINAEDNPLPVLPTDFTTGGEFTSTDLTVDATTGEVDLTNATAGTYEVTYTVETDNSTCTAGGSYTTQIQLDEGQTAVTNFNYPDDICVLSESVLPDLPADFTSGGEFTSDNLTVNANTGEIDLTNATAGTYTVTYTVESDNSTCLVGGSTSVNVTLIDSETPIIDFTYPDNICLLNDHVMPDLAEGFAQGGEFSAPGLDIDPVSGEIDLTTATAGTYTVTYTMNEDADNCISNGSSSIDITLIDASEPVTDFSYDEPVCLGRSSVTPHLAEGFTSGGTFTSPNLDIDPATGEIDLSSASEGSYVVTYTFETDNANCISEGSTSIDVELTQSFTPVTGFSYEQDMYCMANDNALPILDEGFTQGGTFASSSGLAINAQNGKINFAQSEPGEYTITYEVEADPSICQEEAVTSYTLTVYDTVELRIDQDCVDKDLVLTVTPNNGSINPDNLTYIWKDEDGQVLSEESNTLNVSDYLNQHPGKTVPLGFSAEVGNGACSNNATYIVKRDACGFIPKGISPNQDGKNDNFDLSGMKVRSISIYNRYGTKVYDRNGGYTNQWHGQSNNGDDLPSATYYYSLRKTDGSSVTGWVYVNRQQ